ncbi:response regulator [Paenibacillus sp. JDR-2]|uniref:response regulator n=1 Tax=Paenibacillus sp. (strain JDR-2) TaxID=324057 RepID=UPI0001664831|nr:response regulator [Paenibacillus sp. JDR-2]ACT03693.1 two component transcriptional regulator, AraC family [Paenibacillus sp. JDR-2]
MITLLIVDDEPNIRKGIRTSIDWEDYGIEVVGEAADGVEGLEKALKLKPHITVTDIRMPLMDGLELSRHLKNQLPDTRIVILSGYEDFSFAKEALAIGVQDYLLKPVGAEELVDLMLKLSEEIKLAEADKRNRQSLNMMINENYQTIKSDFINRILQGGVTDSSAIFDKAELLKIRLSGPEYSILAIDIDDFALMTEDLPENKRELIRFSVMNIAEEVLLSRTQGLVCYSQFDHLIGMMSGGGLRADFVDHVCEEIQQAVKTYLKLSISIGISRNCTDIAVLSTSYAEAFSALKAKIHKGKGSLIRYQESMMSTEMQNVLYPSEEEKVIIGCLKTLNSSELHSAIDQIFDRFAAGQTDAPVIRSICGRLLLMAVSGVEEMSVDVGSIIGTNFNPYREMERFDTLGDLRKWMNDVLHRLSELVQENKNQKFKGVIKTALRYMEENYNRAVSLADVAAIVYVTPNYLSRIFKEEIGVNFVEWLNRYRIEKAKLLLSEPGAKTYAVAEKVGYSDYKYFSQMFKRFADCSPKEYKELKS